MDTREFLRRYAHVYLYVAAFFLGISALLRHSVETAGLAEPFISRQVIVIDAGHGGEDGGTTGVSGTAEDEVNLQIALRLETMLTLMGCQTEMTRRDGGSLSTEGETIRARKQSDLRNRVEIANRYPGAILVSIHQNHFPDPQYDGAQVFYTRDAQTLAESMQTTLVESLSPKSHRSAKQARGIYLMEQIGCPGVLVECGFLSNPTEEQKLRRDDYQKKLAAVMASVLVRFLDGQV